jgi:hypothetical protein
MGFREIKEIANAIGDMESGCFNPKTQQIEPMPYIVLRHQDYSNTDGHMLFGLNGIRTIKVTGVSGNTETRTYVDENRPCTFYHDRNNVQFAVIPDCKKNRNVLLVPNNVRVLLMNTQGGRAPVLTIVEAPEDLKDKIEKIKVEIATAIKEKKPVPKAVYAKVPNNGTDPFNYMVSDQKMAVDGETSTESFT